MDSRGIQNEEEIGRTGKEHGDHTCRFGLIVYSNTFNEISNKNV